MNAVACPTEVVAEAIDAPPAPFATVFVTLTKQEHIALAMEAKYWKSQHQRAAERMLWREQRHQQEVHELKDQAALREATLRAELDMAKAKIRDLQKRLFGRKSERSKGRNEVQVHESAARLHRGHQRGAPGHGRMMQPDLPERVEVIGLDSPECPSCGLALGEFAGTDDSQVLEIEVQAYRRVIRRRRYRPMCDCGCVPGIVTAPPPSRLIERGKYGVSVWPFAGRISDATTWSWPTPTLGCWPGR